MKDEKDLKSEEPYKHISARYQAMLQSNKNFPYENQRCRNATEMERTLEEIKNVDKTFVPRDYTGIDGRPIKKSEVEK